MEVRRPIDLTTVTRRLRRGTYNNSAGRLKRDIVRIFTNCEKFNTGSVQLFVGIARHLRVREQNQSIISCRCDSGGCVWERCIGT